MTRIQDWLEEELTDDIKEQKEGIIENLVAMYNTNSALMSLLTAHKIYVDIDRRNDMRTVYRLNEPETRREFEYVKSALEYAIHLMITGTEWALIEKHWQQQDRVKANRKRIGLKD